MIGEQRFVCLHARLCGCTHEYGEYTRSTQGTQGGIDVARPAAAD